MIDPKMAGRFRLALCQAWGCLVVLVPCVVSASTVVQSFTVEDPLARKLGRQLVSENFQAPEGSCTAASLRLVGPSGEVPCQLTDIEKWPDGESIKTARLWFLVDLSKRPSQAMRVAADGAPRKEASTAGLLVAESPGVVEIQTPRLGARFHVGTDRFSPPIAAELAPAPLAAIRDQDGAWFGGSQLYGTKRIVSCRSVIQARGPVFAQVHHTYDYEDGTALELTARIVADGATIAWSMNVTPLNHEEAVRHVVESWPPEDPFAPRDPVWRNGWRLVLGAAGDPPLTLATSTEFGTNRWGAREWEDGKWVEDAKDVVISEQQPGLLMNLVPWSDWWDDQTQTEIVISQQAARQPWFIRSTDAGDWVEPAAPGTWAPWGNRRMRQKWAPLVHDKDGAVYLQFSLASGQRRFMQGLLGPNVGLEVDEARRLVLAWPGDRRSHPRLYMSGQDLDRIWRGRTDEKAISSLVSAAGRPLNRLTEADCAAAGAWLLSGDRRVAESVRLVERLKSYLAMLGDFDRKRHTQLLCGLYDAAMAGKLLSEEERRLCRAQMAFLAYRTADPANWSMERGYCSGNLNMSVSHACNQGLLACLLADHPKAEEWSHEPLAMVDRMLATRVGPAGEWPESVANYASVSISAMLPLAVAARRVGWHDFISDERMKRLMLFLAKQYSPPDPRPAEWGVTGVSGFPPVGRGGARGRDGLSGLMARATAEADPDYSAVQQWVWRRCGMPRRIPDARLGGWEHVYLDTQLPASPPAWSLDVFPGVGGIMRHGVGTPAEWYVYLMTERRDALPSESGGLPLVFAKGAPIIARFSGGYAEREELFINRVLPARERGDHAFRMKHFFHEGTHRLTAWADTPGMQYLRGSFTIDKPTFLSHEHKPHDRMKDVPSWPPVPKAANGSISWDRQVLFAKDDDPAGPNTIFLRDTVTGGQPTMWQMWFVSDGISGGESRATRNTNEPTDPRPLVGDRFVVNGQYGIDTDVFVASPQEEPRHTLRWGTRYNYTPLNGVEEAMDLLHLQRPSDGSYFVALSPRRRGEPRATYAPYADNRVIKVSMQNGVDYGFLSAESTDAEAEAVRFKGTAGTVAYRRGSTTASLAARGGIQFAHRGPGQGEAWEFAATAPAAVRLEGDQLTVWFHESTQPMGIRLEGPAEWSVDGPFRDVRIEHRDDGLRLSTAGKAGSVRFRRRAADPSAPSGPPD
jgi:hypothetical protein